MAEHIFAYWEGRDRTPIEAFIDEWSAAFPGFRVYGDAEVLPLLDTHFPRSRRLYEGLRLAAAKSDIARLVLLLEHGGLYVDCHMGLVDAAGVRDLVARLGPIDAIFLDRAAAYANEPKGHADERWLCNGAIASRPGFVLLLDACRQALRNLERQRATEEGCGGFFPYDVTSLTGGEVLTSMVMQPGSLNCDIRWGFEKRIEILPEEDAPFARARHATYNASGRHWSERQRSERLFDHADGSQGP